MEAWELVRFLHVVALAFFVGGQIMLVVAIVPIVSHRDEAVMRAVARRFGVASAAAIAPCSPRASRSRRTSPADRSRRPPGGRCSLALVASSLTVVWLGVARSH